MAKYFAGVDLGSSFVKAVIIDSDKKVLAQQVTKTGASFEKALDKALPAAIKSAAIKESEIEAIVSTGVGRVNCPSALFNKPEINCLSKGAYHLYPRALTVIDIGGQDNKIIHISAEGKQLSFKMNRKCASGTGSFLEEISYKLDLSLEEMNRIATEASEQVGIGSFCTVFAGTEVIHQIREGREIGAIIRGVFDSVVKRVLDMDQLDCDIVLTGGAVKKCPIIKDIFKQHLHREVHVPDSPQIVGAIGAALYAHEHFFKKG